MKLKRKLSRRSFLATVTGAAVTGGTLAAFGSEAGAMQVTDSDPGDPVGRGRGGSGTRTGVTDRDPGDPIGRGRGGSGGSNRTGVTDGDPTDPIGQGRGGSAGRSGCSDSDPTDPGGNGRNCGGTHGGGGTDSGGGGGGGGGGGEAYPTGRRERRYEVCWVDHPSRSNEECNMQTYSEWAITYSDGRVEYDTSESQARHAEMTARGYTARWHRMTVNEW